MRFVCPLAIAALSVAACAPSAESGLASGDGALASGATEYEAWAALAAREGSAPPSGRALVIGVRGRSADGTRHPTRVVEAYDDTLVVLTTDRRAVVFEASTHPWLRESTGAPDVDGDGRRDVGMIRPGRYVAVRRPANRNIAGAPTWEITMPGGSGRLPGTRNTDHDNVYSDQEAQASLARGDTLTAVLFHRAGEGAPDLIGCQGLGAEIGRFAAVVGDRFDYLLVDANEEEEIP